MTCPLELPNCKRKLMTSNKPFEKKQCPLNIKPECALSPPTCPLLPQKGNKCGYAKLLGENISVNQCPCKTCFMGEGCPISLSPCPNNIKDVSDQEAVGKWPDNIPPCFLCTSDNAPIENKINMDKFEKSNPNKIASTAKNTQIVAQCSLISSPRPLPCSECILHDLSTDKKSSRKVKSCPYLLLPNVCGKNCYCPDVPSVEIGPVCPFAPKPCPCCAKPRCPLSREPECALQSKPPCCLEQSKSSSSSPCCCGLCVPCSKPLCGNCFPGPSCPVSNANPVPCPLVNPCGPCIPPVCNTCSQPSCPLSNVSCSPLLPCIGQFCSSPNCIPCVLKKVECFLNPCSCPTKSICPPIPPPCSLNSDPPDPTSEPNETLERTFHLPTCPSYIPPCGAHMSLKQECPFSPNPCPIGCVCPFPVSMSLEDEKNDFREQKLKEETMTKKPHDDPISSKISSKVVKFDVTVLKGLESDDSELEEDEEDANQNFECPYSSKCGVIPLPTCPAAEILCPDIYIKPKKVEKKTCPFKKCLKKQGCPLGKLMPEVDCKLPSCPMTKEPDCPIGELINKCPVIPESPCSCLCPVPVCCPVSLPCPLNGPCECTSTDGQSRSLLLASSVESTLSSSYSSTPLTSPLSSKQDFLDSVSCESILRLSSSNISLPLKLLNTEKPVSDGCCCKNNNAKLSRDLCKKSSSSTECPFEPLAPKRNCRFAPPKCPLTPKPTTCPLTRKPEPCALSAGGKIICPVKFPPCKKFRTGKCPMENLNICDCDYPVSACMLPLQDSNVIAPPQYCFREDCCMGLPYPPSVLKTADGEIEKGPYYQFKDTKPGKEETKHYVQISKDPLNLTIALFGNPRERVHENWTIVRHGEGYRKCKTIAKKLKKMGPIRNLNTQYDSEDCPIDEETRMIMENRKNHERDRRELENLKLTLGIIKKKNQKRKK